MAKRITSSQLLGELGETAVRKCFLSMGFQFDPRSRVEAGIDGIAEVMIDGEPQARMIAVQVKTTEEGAYTSETDESFTYLLKTDDLAYWQNSNLPVILVLYRVSDNSFYWKDVGAGIGEDQRRLQFNKAKDALDQNAADTLAALTVPKSGPGYFVPPLGGGEDGLVNMLPLALPEEIFVASSPYSGRRAASVLLEAHDNPRFDWVIKGDTFWSFHDPREDVTQDIVDIDQVEAIETGLISMHEDRDEQNNFAFLLCKTLQHQFGEDLRWHKDKGLFYFRAREANTSRVFSYEATKKKAETTVVNVVTAKNDPERVSFVRHHAFIPRFENLLGQWHLIITPTYHFTTNGFIPHSYPDALLSGKKRLDNNASLRGQVIMWHRFLTEGERSEGDLFSDGSTESRSLRFGEPPIVRLPTSVPEDAWGQSKATEDEFDGPLEELWSDAV